MGIAASHVAMQGLDQQEIVIVAQRNKALSVLLIPPVATEQDDRRHLALIKNPYCRCCRLLSSPTDHIPNR